MPAGIQIAGVLRLLSTGTSCRTLTTSLRGLLLGHYMFIIVKLAKEQVVCHGRRNQALAPLGPWMRGSMCAHAYLLDTVEQSLSLAAADIGDAPHDGIGHTLHMEKTLKFFGPRQGW
jgi:hypothetical protein